jgi:hypothetical protein
MLKKVLGTAVAFVVGLALLAGTSGTAKAETVRPPYGYHGPVYHGGWGYGYYHPYFHRAWVPGYWAFRPWGRVWIEGYWR